TENLLDIFLSHGGDQDAGVAPVGDEVVADGIQRVTGTVAGDVVDGTAGVFRVVRRDGEAERIPRWNPSQVIQAMGGQFFPYTGSDRRLAQPLEHALHATLLNPGREQVAQG